VSTFHTATICGQCDPPVVALSTGHGTRCPRCGQIEDYSSFVMAALDVQSDGALARQVLTAVAIRSDGDARLLHELAGRLLARTGEQTGGAREELATNSAPCPHCKAGEPSIWDGELFHYAHPAGSKLKACHSPWRPRCLRCSAVVTQANEEFCGRHQDVSP